MSQIRELFTRIGLVVASTAFALAVIEVVLHFWNPFGLRLKGDRIVLPVNIIYNITLPTTVPLSGLDPVVIHRKNSLGMRGPEPPADLANRLSIITIGGSTTECFYLSDGKTWPDRLAILLAPSFNGLWLDNAGLDGHSTFRHIVLMEDVIIKLRPKVVVFLVGVNDLARSEAMLPDLRNIDSGLRISSPLAFVYCFTKKSEVAGLALAIYRSWQARNMAVDHDFTTAAIKPQEAAPTETEVAAELDKNQESIGGYRKRLDRLIAVANEHAILPVFVTQPSRARPMAGEPAPMSWRVLDRYNDETRAVAAQRGVPLVDLARALPGDPAYYYDNYHFSIAGAEAVGRAVASTLCPLLAERFPQYRQASCPAL